jgi:very-short-patch-repair endonuclease
MRRAQLWRTSRARTLRSSATSTEDQLWAELRGRRLGGLKFVRQCPIGPYFADFACRERKVIVEVDGNTHFGVEGRANDAKRSAWLTAHGYRIFRVTNDDVLDDMVGVRGALLDFVLEDKD